MPEYACACCFFLALRLTTTHLDAKAPIWDHIKVCGLCRGPHFKCLIKRFYCISIHSMEQETMVGLALYVLSDRFGGIAGIHCKVNNASINPSGFASAAGEYFASFS